MYSFEKNQNKKKNNINYLKIGFLIFLLSSTIIFLIGIYLFVTSWKVQNLSKEIKNSLSKAGRYEMIYFPKILYNSFLSNFNKIESLNINLKYEDELILENYRKKAIRDNTLSKESTAQDVNISIENQNNLFNGQMRLKGGRNAHWNEKRYSSYKIKLGKETYFMGMRKFSLSKPRMRNYIHEWLFHEMGKEFGLINLNYKFINLSINGDDRGLYVLEEGFGKELIERSKRRNGPIFSLHEELNMNYRFFDKSANSILEVYNKKYWLNNENYSLTEAAANKLNKFLLQEELDLENVFDIEKWAAYLAICDFLYTFHGAQIKSVRFYYNPVNGLFEPVLFDGHRNRNSPNYNNWNNNYNNQIIFDYVFNHSDAFFRDDSLQWLRLFFLKNQKNLNKKFYESYLKKLNEITSNEFLNNFYYSREKKIKNINNHIYSDYYLFDNGDQYGPGFYYFSKKDFFHRAQKIREKISSYYLATNQRFQAGIEDQELIIKNFVRTQYYGLFEIRTLKCQNDIDLIDGNGNYKTINYNTGYNPEDKSSETDHHNLLIETRVDLTKFHYEQTNKCKNLIIKNILTDKEYNLELDQINFGFYKNTIEKNNYKKHFVKIGDNIYLKSDIEIIKENLIIPKNFSVIIKPGQKIILKNNAFIFSNSSWIADGEKETIYITGQKDNFGGGLIINGPKKKSYFNNVNFSYLNGLKKDYFNKNTGDNHSTITSYISGSINAYDEKIIRKKLNKSINGFLIMGSLNIYNSKVDLINLKINKINSEDAINIINSEFMIKNLEFEENSSDSIDFDFSNGIIESVTFKNIGNDAIDFSGSKANVKNIYFENVNDKLISVGENSNINIEDIDAKNSYLGIASKDGSTTFIEKVKMEDVKIPFASYNKKEEYKFSKLILKDIDILNFHEKWLTDDNSKIFYDNKEVGKKISNIIPIIYRKNLEKLEMVGK